jgi:predicted NUDIX family phosphoesterase
MAKEALVIPRGKLVESGLIPSEQQTEGRYAYTPLQSLGDLRRLLTVSNSSGEYRERYGEHGVETDPSVQQVIMYGFVQRDDGRFLLYQRGATGQYDENRLAGKVSVGIGGHMEPTDLTLARSFYRELDEEAEILVNGTPLQTRNADGSLNLQLMKQHVRVSPVGIIKDERDEVGKVHLGVVSRIVPQSENVDIRVRTGQGQENITSQYVTPQEYAAMQNANQIQAEGWTDVVMREEILPDSQEKTFLIPLSRFRLHKSIT